MDLKKAAATATDTIVQELRERLHMTEEQLKEAFAKVSDLEAVVDHQQRVMSGIQNLTENAAGHVNRIIEKVQEETKRVSERMDEILFPDPKKTKKPKRGKAIDTTRAIAHHNPPPPTNPPMGNLNPPAGDLTAAQKKILDAIHWWISVGVEHPTRQQVGFVAGYTMNGHFNNTVSSMRSSALIDYPSRGCLSLTRAGWNLSEPPAVPATTEALQDLVRTQLNSSQQKILDVCLGVWPNRMSRADLAERAGYTENGHFNNTVSRMRTLGFIDYPERGYVAASDLLFLEAAA